MGDGFSPRSRAARCYGLGVPSAQSGAAYHWRGAVGLPIDPAVGAFPVWERRAANIYGCGKSK